MKGVLIIILIKLVITIVAGMRKVGIESNT